MTMEQDHAEQAFQATLEAEQHQLVLAHHALLEAHAAQEGNARIAADQQQAENGKAFAFACPIPRSLSSRSELSNRLATVSASI